MVSKLEMNACSTLRGILKPLNVGDIIQDSDDFRKALNILEWYIPEVLAERYENPETLDGLYSGMSVKNANNGFELSGMCIFISDQTLTPINLRGKISENSDDFEWFNCRLSEITQDGPMRIPYSSSKWGKYMYNLQVDCIEWEYEVEYKKS